MKTKPRFIDSGSTLMIVVLVTMLVLAGLVVMTSNLALGSRRSTTEQKSIIPAQMAAESGVAYAKSKLDIAHDILSQSRVPDKSITFGDAQKALSNLCPQPVTVPAPNYNNQKGSVQVNDTSITVNDALLLCNFPADSRFTDQQASIFVLSTPNPAQQSANRYLQNGLDTSEATKTKLFRDLFSYNDYVTIDNTKLKSGLRPLALLQTGKNEYSLYFKVAGIDSLGEVANAQRRVSSGSNESVGIIRFKFETAVAPTPPPNPNTPPAPPPVDDGEVSFANFGYFANTYNNFDGVLTGAYRLTGRIHSNTPLAWANSSPQVPTRPPRHEIGRGAHASAQIGGPLGTSDCDTIQTTIAPNGDRIDSCSRGIRGPGFYAGPNQFVSANTMNKLASVGDINFTSYTGYNGTYNVYNTLPPNTVNPMVQPLGVNLLVEKGQPAPNLKADFIRFPLNDTTQKAAATSQGIVLDNPLRVKLEVEGSGDSAIQKIIVTDKSEKTYTLSYGKDKIMYIDTGSGRQKAKKDGGSPGWVADPSANDYFGGVIYVNGELTSLTGPERRNASDPNSAAPAIAKFSNINVTASKDINLTGDLKYEVRCTEMQPCLDAQGNRTADNMLGIYSAGGHVNTMLMKATDRQITLSSPGNRLRLNAPSKLELDAFIMAGRGGFGPRYVDQNGTEGKSAGGRHLDSIGCNCQHGMTLIRGGLIVDRSINTGYTRNAIDFGRPPTVSSGFDFYIEYDKRGERYGPVHYPTGSVEGKGGSNPRPTTPTPVTPTPPAPTPPAPTPVNNSTELTNWSVIFAKVDNTTGQPIEQGGVFAKPDFSLDKEIIQEKAPAQEIIPTGGN